MADDDADSVLPGAKRDAAADAIALQGASRGKADSYLDEQIGLSRLQRESLIEQNAFELSHLRWRRFNDQMKGAMQIMLVMLGLLVVVGIGTAMWNASQADGLVVDSFSVPPSFASAGVGGDVVADDMTDKIAAVRDFANEHSLARSKDVREDGDQGIKVEIPETGISLAEAYRYLRQWLGHEQHLRGNIRALPNGQIALTIALGSADSFALTGAPADLDKLEQQAAERVFGTVDPVNFVLYLNGKGRQAETLAAAEHLVSLGGDNTVLSESYSLDANMIRFLTGDVRRSVSLAQLAIGLDPRPAPQHMELLNSERMLGHDEVVLEQARLIGGLRREDNIGSWRTGDGVPFVWQLGAFYRAKETGDFADMGAQPCIYLCSLTDAALRSADAQARLYNVRGATVLLDKALAAGRIDGADLAVPRFDIEVAKENWPGAILDARSMASALNAGTQFSARFRSLYIQIHAMPLLAYALARSGNFTEAKAAIITTPADCYDCVRMRGKIDGLQKNWPGAVSWFADAVKQAPSIPFAFADWGQMLMAKSDYDGAIAKFASANQKGPHFADPLVMWGEALIAKNRSDLALPKFEEANKYAPNWGRLHLKWGEALWWSGDKDSARKQFAVAAVLDLTPSEKSELTRMKASHG